MPLYLGLLWLVADWLNVGGNARHDGRQPDERDLTAASAPGIKLLWQRQPGTAKLSAPVILGRLITYRGSVALVFVASADGNVYALDADFGKVFWTRQLEFDASRRCPTITAPALAPLGKGVDADDDGPQPFRGLYVVAPDGMLHVLDPVNGKDHAAPRRFGCPPSLYVDARGRAHAWNKAVPDEVRTPALVFRVKPDSGVLTVSSHAGPLVWQSPALPLPASPLAVADSRVCVVTATDTTVRCFGLPPDR